jgi:ferredoxin
MDGIVAMEGEGPAAGGLRRLGVVLASRDAVSLDAIVARMVGMNPMDIYTTRYCDERGVGVGRLDNIEVVGEKLESVAVLDFRAPASATSLVMQRVPGFLPRLITRQFSIRPRVIKGQCTGCGECQKICPTGAIAVTGKEARINTDLCIKCMCCNEVCRFNAIVPTRSTVGRLVHLLGIVVNKLRSTSAWHSSQS